MIRVRFICKVFLVVAMLAGIFHPAVAADATAQKAAVTIEAGETGEPISKYIYGQFIEHQGRCIYGGIWAEMLEDRKFYYPIEAVLPGIGVITQGGMGIAVGAEKSPWRPIGLNENIVMSRDNSYVGEHSPKIILNGQGPCGIVQAKLALRKGKKYEGRIVLAGAGLVKVQVSLVWGPDCDDKQTVNINNLTMEYTKTPLSFTAGGDTDNGRIEIVGRGEGSFYIGAVSLMPADNIYGMRADTIKLLKELNATIYRWPGGSFIGTYNWRDGIGDSDKRPALRTIAYYHPESGWVQTLESNDFGLDDFMTFCHVLGTDAYIAVNTISDNVVSAVAQIEYANGGLDTPMGRLRASNGHREPYNVKFWGVDNETWVGMTLPDYIDKYNFAAKAMRKADPTIKLIGVGQVNVGPPDPDTPGSKRMWGELGDWSEGMLRKCSGQLDVLSDHHVGGGLSGSAIDHVQQIPGAVRAVANAYRDYRKRLESLKNKNIGVSLDEWSYYHGDEIYGEAAPRRFHQDGLGIATGLHEMFRYSDVIFMANKHAVNVYGSIKTTKTNAAFEVSGLVLKLYRNHFGNLPVAITGNAELLDIAVAWTDDRKALTVGIVNPTKHKYELTIEIRDAQLAGEGRFWQIVHSDPMAYNEPGKEPQVVIEEKQPGRITNMLSMSPLSVSLYELSVR